MKETCIYGLWEENIYVLLGNSLIVPQLRCGTICVGGAKKNDEIDEQIIISLLTDNNITNNNYIKGNPQRLGPSPTRVSRGWVVQRLIKNKCGDFTSYSP